MTRSDFGMAPKSFLYWCKGKIIYRKNPISCSGQSTNSLSVSLLRFGFVCNVFSALRSKFGIFLSSSDLSGLQKLSLFLNNLGQNSRYKNSDWLPIDRISLALRLPFGKEFWLFALCFWSVLGLFRSSR